MNLVFQVAILLIAGCVSISFASPPMPEADEPFDQFVVRWNAWVDSVPEDQRAGDALIKAIDEINAEAFTFGELWDKRAFNEGDVLTEAFPWNEYWKDASGVFETFESQLNQVYEIASRPHYAAKIIENTDPKDLYTLPEGQIFEYSSHSSSLRTAAGFMAGHAGYLAFNGHPDLAYSRLLAVDALAKHTSEMPVVLHWLSDLGVEMRFRSTIIEMIEFDPDLFTDEHLAGFQSVIIEQLGSGFADTLAFEQWLTQETWRALFHGQDPKMTNQDIGEYFYAQTGSPDCLIGNALFVFNDASNPPSNMSIESLENQIKLYQDLNDALLHDLRQDPASQQSLRSSRLVNDYLAGEDAERYIPVVLEIFLWDSLLGLQHMLDYEARNTLVVLGIYRHRLRTGNWPNSLSDIDPALLPYSTTDLYSGKPLNYKLGRKGPVLWAHGADRDYEGGSMFNKGTDEYLIKKWFTLDEWDTLSDEDQAKHNGDWKFWQHPTP